VRELIALAKSKPGQLTYASNGAGGSSHMAVELFQMTTGTKLLHVPYKGLSPALTDLISGQVQVMFSSAVAMLPQVKVGRLRAIAMTGGKRSPAIPDLPTVAEAGVPGYETGSWYGVVMPAGTPKPVVSRLAKEIAAIAKSPDINERLLEDAAIPVGSTPEEFGAFIRKELARWAKVVQQGRISLE
jgi:tripartite-type tricarboxylate transporter receptor subunit TctC